MSEFVKAQQEVRANLVSQIQESLDAAEERGGLDAETTEKIDRIEADIRKADEAIKIAERQEERKHEASLAARGFVVAEEERTEAHILREIAETRGAHTFEKRDITTSANTVPKSFFDQVFDIARLVGPMLDESEVINTTTGEDLTIPTLTGYGSASLTAEGSAISEDDPTYSSITLGAFKYGQLIQVSQELVTDAQGRRADIGREQKPPDRGHDRRQENNSREDNRMHCEAGRRAFSDARHEWLVPQEPASSKQPRRCTAGAVGAGVQGAIPGGAFAHQGRSSTVQR